MKQLPALVLLSLIVGGVLFVVSREDVPGGSTVAAESASVPMVRIKQELVTAKVVTPMRAPIVAATPRFRTAATRRALPQPSVQRAFRDPTVLERARKALVGDGRYRPEPFPRVNQQQQP